MILSPEGPRLIDFGIAKVLDDTAMTHTGTLIGSPGWISPVEYGDAWRRWQTTQPEGTGDAPECPRPLADGHSSRASRIRPLAPLALAFDALRVRVLCVAPVECPGHHGDDLGPLHISISTRVRRRAVAVSVYEPQSPYAGTSPPIQRLDHPARRVPRRPCRRTVRTRSRPGISTRGAATQR